MNSDNFVDRNSSVELSQTLETVISILSSKNLISPPLKNDLSQKERVRLIRMVHKVIQLANEVLNLNYTTTATKLNVLTTNQYNKRNDNKNFSEILPINLFSPCTPNDPNLIQSNINQKSSTIEENILDDYEFSEFEITQSKSVYRMFRKFKIGFDLLQEMIHRANHLKGLVTDMIRKNLIKDCLKLEVPHIFQISNIPQYNISDTLTAIYQSLANQTAHLYFIWTEQKRYSNRNDGCTSHRRFELSVPSQNQQDPSKLYTPEALNWITRINKKSHLRMISNDFLMVSNNLRSIMCYLSQAIQLFDIPVPIRTIVQQVLSHKIRFNVSCSRRSIFECQLMRDAVKFFTDIEEFLRKESHQFLTAATATTATNITSG